MGLTFQKGKGAYPEVGDRHEKVEALKKLQELRDNDTVILFQDEASLSNTATVSYMWPEKGKQPKINQKQRKRERKTLFGCIEPKTGIVFTSKADKGNTITFFSFLRAVVKSFTDKNLQWYWIMCLIITQKGLSQYCNDINTG